MEDHASSGGGAVTGEGSNNGGVYKNTKIDINSPYYLGTNDNPSNTITKIVFRGENYEEWSRSIRLSLRARRKYGFFDGSIAKPTETEKLEDWYCVQSMLVQWIMNTIEDSVKKTIPYFEEVKPLWDILKERFSVGNGARIQQLKGSLAECRQSVNMSVVEYFGRLQTLWDELASYEPIPACKCGGCTCDIPKLLQKRMDEERFHQFLYGINGEIYGNVRSNLLSQEPFPTLARAYQTMLQEERLRSSVRAKTERGEIMAFALKSRNNNGGAQRFENRDKSELLCTYCNRTGHEETECFAKIGFPDWWGDRPRGNGRGGGRTRGGGGGGSSATAGRGRGRGRGEYRANVAHATTGTGTTGNLDGMNAIQWQQLMEMIGEHGKKSTNERMTGKSLNLCWIIDSGANNHVTGNLDVLDGVKNISECLVGLPNGESASTTKCGSAKVVPEITLKMSYMCPN